MDADYTKELNRLSVENANLAEDLLDAEMKNTELRYFFEKQAENMLKKNNKLVAELDYWRRKSIEKKSTEN
ncbi:MAG: hypothetical protein ACERKN_07185 [Velocimicrobium sp.]